MIFLILWQHLHPFNPKANLGYLSGLC